MFLRPTRRRLWSDSVDPHVPITPLLDVSLWVLFWLVFVQFFFLLMVPPVPPPDHIPLELSGNTSDPLSNQLHYVVRVTATQTGTIASMQLREAGAWSESDLGDDLNNFRGEMRKLHVEHIRSVMDRPSPKLTLEIGDKLLHGYVIQLLDVAIQVGFRDLALVPIDPLKR